MEGSTAEPLEVFPPGEEPPSPTEPDKFLTEEEREALRFMTAPERARYVKLVREQYDVGRGRKRRPKSFREFIDYVTNGRFRWYRYAETLVRVLEDVVAGKRKRVLIFAPPRHGKSEPTSRLLPAYYLYRHPDRWVGLTSYGAELAHTFSRAARSNYTAGAGVISSEAAAVKQWETGRGGGLWAAGAGGPGVGKGYHLGIIDDPYKNAEEASSILRRNRLRDWYSSVFYLRAEPDAAIVIILQRWDEEDLAGWLLEQEHAFAAEEAARERGEDLTERADELGLLGDPEAGEDVAEHWHIVNFEALKRDPEEVKDEARARGRPQWPATCTVEPDWRVPGEALEPSRYNAARLRKIRARIGEYFFNALYQQNPRPRSGGMFALDAIKEIEDFDRLGAVYIRWWDFASTSEKENKAADFSVGALMARTRHGAYVLVDLQRGQWDQKKRDRMIRAAAESDRATYGLAMVRTWGAQDPGSGGKDAAANFRRLLEGFTVSTEPETGSKVSRADGLSSTAAAGNLYMLKAVWNATVRKELVDFPRGRFDDIVDAMAGAYNKLAGLVRGTLLPPTHSA